MESITPELEELVNKLNLNQLNTLYELIEKRKKTEPLPEWTPRKVDLAILATYESKYPAKNRSSVVSVLARQYLIDNYQVTALVAKAMYERLLAAKEALPLANYMNPNTSIIQTFKVGFAPLGWVPVAV